MAEAKTVKVKPSDVNLLAPVGKDDAILTLWGFDFTVERKDGEVTGLVCEMSKEDADANIKAGRVAKA